MTVGDTACRYTGASATACCGRIRNGLLRPHPQRPAAGASATACCGRIRNGLLRPHPGPFEPRTMNTNSFCGPSSGITDFF
jgi:hypothetical protein